MERLFTATPLVNLLSSLPVRSPRKQLQLWTAQKDMHILASRLLCRLGRGITKAQAKRLATLSITYEVLVQLRTEPRQMSSVTHFGAGESTASHSGRSSPPSFTILNRLWFFYARALPLVVGSTRPSCLLPAFLKATTFHKRIHP